MKIAPKPSRLDTPRDRTRLYLDIDGVLLHRGGDLVIGAGAFLDWAVQHHDVVWLSTRTHDGRAAGAERALAGLVDRTTLGRVRAAAWQTLKTESLPLADPGWFWIDDAPLYAERTALAAAGVTHRLLRVDVRRDPAALVDLPGRIDTARAAA